MLVRYGYEIALTCTQPMALVGLLSVHEDRAADILDPEKTFTTPIVPVSFYRDLYGNRCSPNIDAGGIRPVIDKTFTPLGRKKGACAITATWPA
jgi:hypothetical protein